jgi:hypothetical protein
MFNLYRTPVETLKEVYLESGNEFALRKLIEKGGYLVLLDLDTKGLKILSRMIFVEQKPELLFAIPEVRKLKWLFNYVLEEYSEYPNTDSPDIEDLSEGLLKAVGEFNWESGRVLSKTLVEERYNFLIKLLKTETQKPNFRHEDENDLFRNIVQNKFISLEVLFDKLLPSVPELGRYIIQLAPYKLAGQNDIFHIIDTIGRVKDILCDIKERNETCPDPEKEVKNGIDLMLEEPITRDLLFGLFVSVNKISRQIIYYRLEEFKTFFERFTLMIKDVKETVDFYIENTNEQEGLFPLGPINDEISNESLEGLAYCLYHGSTIASYNIAKDDRFLMSAIDDVAVAMGLYIYMNILPENWLTSDEYYQLLLSQEGHNYAPETSELNVDELVEGLF